MPSEVEKTCERVKLSSAHHQLAGEALLCVAVALSQSGEEPGHTLILLQSGVALEGLLDHPT